MLDLTITPKVFSAHAEVVPLKMKVLPGCTSILRARGGSSLEDESLTWLHQYSPRTRR